jgi:hypothetical protein
MKSVQIVLDCGPLKNADVDAVERIARLQLAARRRGLALRLRNADADLLELIGLVGLGGVLRVEPGRQTEQREEPGRVEEEGELDDPPA